MDKQRQRDGGGAGYRISAFRGHADADTERELEGEVGALAKAIAEAAMVAAETIEDVQEFEVSRIQITVSPNPGPKSYTVTVTPTG
jgi:hypothetical protein